jgi:RES domain-containing protein
MSTLWRITNHVDLAGNGGRYSHSRWSLRGSRIVFLAESPAGAMLEVLVHLPFAKGALPDEYNLLRIEVADECSRRDLNPPRGKAWKDNQGLTQRIGGTWLGSRETALARIPSAVLPFTWNWLLNPEHPDAAQVRIQSVIRERFDNRLFHFGPR